MRLASILAPSCVVLDVGSGSKREVLARLAAPIAAIRPDLEEAALAADLLRREEASSTAIADGIAIPHAKGTAAVVTASLGLSPAGLHFDSLDGKPTRILVALISPASDPSLHVRWLAHIAAVLGDADLRERLLAASDAGEVLAILAAREDAVEQRA
jgi:PTS system fructose-specific IIC component